MKSRASGIVWASNYGQITVLKPRFLICSGIATAATATAAAVAAAAVVFKAHENSVEVNVFLDADSVEQNVSTLAESKQLFF